VRDVTRAGTNSHATAIGIARCILCRRKNSEETRAPRYGHRDAAGTKVQGYRRAELVDTKHSTWALDILAEEGFIYDSSIYPFIMIYMEYLVAQRPSV